MLAFTISLITQVLSAFFLVVFQSELSLIDEDTRCLVKFSDLIVVKSLLSLFIRLLNLRLSDRYFVPCKVECTVRYSKIRTQISRKRRGEEVDQANS